MASTVENSIGSEAKVLQSYLGGKWQAGTGKGAPLVNPTTGEIVASASSKGLDLNAALEYSRNVGGPELRKLSYAQRAELLGKIADALVARRDEWFEIARKNSGNTKADAAIDVDGSIGTLKYFAKMGGKLGDAHFLRDGGRCAWRAMPTSRGCMSACRCTALPSTSTLSISLRGDCGKRPR